MLKRALRSLLYHWKKNVMILLLFAALFAVAVGSLCLYATTPVPGGPFAGRPWATP